MTERYRVNNNNNKKSRYVQLHVLSNTPETEELCTRPKNETRHNIGSFRTAVSETRARI